MSVSTNKGITRSSRNKVADGKEEACALLQLRSVDPDRKNIANMWLKRLTSKNVYDSNEY